MSWLFIVSTLIEASIGLVLVYFVTSLIVGREVAQKNLRGILPIGILMGVIMAFLGYHLSNIEFLLFTLAFMSSEILFISLQK